MKKILVLTISYLLCSCSIADEKRMNEEVSQQDLEDLAKKYSVEITTVLNQNSKDKKTQPVQLTKEEIEKMFQDIAAYKKLEAESNKQVALLKKEMEVKMKSGKGGPADYFETLEKYPLAKQQTIEQWGGKEGYEKYRKTLLAKEDSVKNIGALKLKNSQ